MIYAWRRHLAAALARIEALGADAEDLHTTQISVGFADIVGFTALSNELSRDRIGDIVEIFESRCADVVAGQRGRMIKSLGDSVLCVSADPVAVYDIAEGIFRVVGRDPRMPEVRVGLASGNVVMRLGRRVRPTGRPPLAADRGGPPEPGHHRPGNGRPAPRRPVRDPAAARASGARLRLVEPLTVRRRLTRWLPWPGRGVGLGDRTNCVRLAPQLPFDTLRVLTVQDVRLEAASRRVWRGEREPPLAEGFRSCSTP